MSSLRNNQTNPDITWSLKKLVTEKSKGVLFQIKRQSIVKYKPWTLIPSEKRFRDNCGNFNIGCILEVMKELVPIFLCMIIILWLCRRISSFSGDLFEVCRDKVMCFKMAKQYDQIHTCIEYIGQRVNKCSIQLMIRTPFIVFFLIL